MRIGDGLQQTYSSFWPAEEFLLTKAQSENGTDWYYIRTVFRPSLYVDVCSKGADGYDRPTLQEKSDADSQKFCFKRKAIVFQHPGNFFVVLPGKHFCRSH